LTNTGGSGGTAIIGTGGDSAGGRAGGMTAITSGGMATGGLGGSSLTPSLGGTGGSDASDAAIVGSSRDASTEAGGIADTNGTDANIPALSRDSSAGGPGGTEGSDAIPGGDATDFVLAPGGADASQDPDAHFFSPDARPDAGPVFQKLTVALSGFGTGTVASWPPSIACGQGCSANFIEGTIVTLTATPDGPSIFTGWSNACWGTGTCTLTMDAAEFVTASFAPVAVPPVPPVLTVSPSSIDLGNLLVGAVAPMLTINITALTAISDLYVGLNGMDILKDATSTCTSTLAAGTSCTVVVNFAASTRGPKSDSVSVSAGGVNGTFESVPITAVAQNPAKLMISPSSQQSFVTTVGVPSSPIVFGIANGGDVVTGPLSFGIVGTNAQDFTGTATGCSLLASLGECSVSVVFTPKAPSATAEYATLTVTDDGPGASSVSVGLSGTARSPVDLTIAPAATDFGSVSVGAASAVSTFTITNSGDTASGALTVGITAPEFVKVADTCTGVSLAKAATCTVGIQFKPTSVGAKSGFLVVSGASGTPAVDAITGTGT
jgi:hypothetical protein